MIKAILKSGINPAPRNRPRQHSKVKKVELRRMIEAARSLGLSIGGVEVKPDGTISIATVEAMQSGRTDLFSQWSDRL